MIVSRVHPGPTETLQLDAATSRDQLLAWYTPPRRQWLRLNLVTSVSGSAAGSDGTSETLTSPVDRRILGVIRELSNVVLVGAASVRAEGYQLPRRSTLAIVTASGDLAGHQLSVEEPERIVVLCPSSAVGRVHDTLGNARIITVEATDNRISAAALVTALRAAGFESIVCEGGPDLAAQLVAADLVDEVCLTTSPLLAAVSLAPLGSAMTSTVPLELAQLLIDDASGVYARWLTDQGAR